MRFTESAICQLERYSWPGNVRELGNVVAALAVLLGKRVIDFVDLPLKTRALEPGLSPESRDALGLYERLSRFEGEVLRREYLSQKGNVSRMARALRMDRSHLYEKLKEHGIHGQPE